MHELNLSDEEIVLIHDALLYLQQSAQKEADRCENGPLTPRTWDRYVQMEDRADQALLVARYWATVHFGTPVPQSDQRTIQR